MTEAIETITEAPAAPKQKRKVQKRKPAKRAAPAKAGAPRDDLSKFAGITAKDCCNACTADRCVISTVNSCKHPCKTAVSGCGPVTIANREKAMKIIRRQAIDQG